MKQLLLTLALALTVSLSFGQKKKGGPSAEKMAAANTKEMVSDELFMSHLLEFRQVNPESKISNLKDNKFTGGISLKKKPEKLDLDIDKEGFIKYIGDILVEIMDETLKAGRDLLQTFLQCGEIRKLDGAIGKANKKGKLDMGFFTVFTKVLNISRVKSEFCNNAPPAICFVI